MLFEKRYHYYLVKLDDEKTYWYRSGAIGYRVGKKVIVPISNNGKWKIGFVSERHRFKAEEVPYPIDKTKGIIQYAGLFGKGKVRRHNTLIENAKYPPLDISVAHVCTRHGTVRYITCRQERNIAENSVRKNKNGIVMIENYPVSSFNEIPVEAQMHLQRIQRQLCEKERLIEKEKRRQMEEELIRLIEFEEEMEDLDRYNERE